MTAVSDRDKLAYIAAQAADARINVELESDDGMTLNLGPQHPAVNRSSRPTRTAATCIAVTRS